MKIESSTKPSGPLPVKEARTSNARAAAPAQTDDVQLSGLAAQLRATETDDAPVFDAARVTEIKQAIAEGRFSINAGAIADRLITSARELVDAKRQT